MSSTKISDCQDLLKTTIESLSIPFLWITYDFDKEAFFVCLNDENAPVKLPLWEVEQKTNSARNFVNYIKNKLGDPK